MAITMTDSGLVYSYGVEPVVLCRGPPSPLGKDAVTTGGGWCPHTARPPLLEDHGRPASHP